MTKKHLYYLPVSGQLGNQLAILAHLIAFANEFQYDVIYPNSEHLKQSLDPDKLFKNKLFFSKLLSKSSVSYFLIKIIKLFTLNKNISCLGIQVINKRFVVDEQLANLKLPKFIVITDWMFRYYAGVEDQYIDIKSQLSFNDKQEQSPLNFIERLHNRFYNATLIGMHVRRGDYAEWQNGKFFFDISTYYERMKEISTQLSNCVFVVCSNENFVFANEANFNIVYAKGSPVEDICVLSNCQYIIGPPSTFSGWAAFLGHRLIYFIRSKDEPISLDKFFDYQV
jgi:hypothetical protein